MENEKVMNDTNLIQETNTIVTPTKQPKKKRSKVSTKKSRDARIGYLLISPFIIGFLFFMVVPMFQSFRMVFSEVGMDLVNNRFSLKFIGMANLKKVFTVDPEFNRLLVEELTGMVTDVIAIVICSYFIALLLNQKFKGRGLVRAVFFLPVILSSGVIVGLETNNSLLQGMSDMIKDSAAASTSVTGTLNTILVEFGGLGKQMTSLMEMIFTIVNHVYDIAIASGIQIIIFLSALQTIPGSMYEASKIEGCTAWESFWKITFPMSSSMILVNVIYSIIDYSLRTDNKVMEKIQIEMRTHMDYSFSSAMAWSYFVIIAVIVLVVSAIISRRVYYYD